MRPWFRFIQHQKVTQQLGFQEELCPCIIPLGFIWEAETLTASLPCPQRVASRERLLWFYIWGTI
jgi:hypothetical protein